MPSSGGADLLLAAACLLVFARCFGRGLIRLGRRSIASARLLATADLYYQYVHDRMGVFDVVFKLQELFRAGTLRISGGSKAEWEPHSDDIWAELVASGKAADEQQ